MTESHDTPRSNVELFTGEFLERLCTNIRRDHLGRSDYGEQFRQITFEDRVQATRGCFKIITKTFSKLVDEDVAKEIFDNDDTTPSNSRDTVIRWLQLVAPLITPISKDPGTYLSVDSMIGRFRSLNDIVVHHAFWAPYEARHSDRKREEAIDKLYAIALDRAFQERGFDRLVVRQTISKYFKAPNWDTVRKWESVSKSLLGKETSELILQNHYNNVALFTKDNNWAFASLFIYLSGIRFLRARGYRKIPPFDASADLEAWFEQAHRSEAEN